MGSANPVEVVWSKPAACDLDKVCSTDRRTIYRQVEELGTYGLRTADRVEKFEETAKSTYWRLRVRGRQDQYRVLMRGVENGTRIEVARIMSNHLEDLLRRA